MGWFQSLIAAYDACTDMPQFAANPLPPISHTPQQAHIEIVLDAEGGFRRARVLGKGEALAPATEDSAGRSGSGAAPHPFCDKIQYVAADYAARGGLKSPFHAEYLDLLGAWCASPFAHPKAQAVLTYVRRGTVVEDLVREQVLLVDEDGHLLRKWSAPGAKPGVFRTLSSGRKGYVDQGDAFVRWQVEMPGDPSATVAHSRKDDTTTIWVAGDASLQGSWISFYASQMERRGLCMASGALDVGLSFKHPRRIRHAGDGAKLISMNDSKGFTFRGRFTDDAGEQACSVGYVASQKAHAALRWLIARQASRDGDQVFVAWSTSSVDVPDPLGDTFALFGLVSSERTGYAGDAGQSYSIALRHKIAGYRAALPSSSLVVLMGLDSATPGRLAIPFYREFSGGEFLERLETWHRDFAWPQNFGGKKIFVGAPSPSDVVEAAYGVDVASHDDCLQKFCIQRLLHCIVDGRPVPRDIVELTFRRASRPVGQSKQQWEKTLGIACALYRGHAKGQRSYEMSLETSLDSRDYLFGRLLALADHMERRALDFAKEYNADTNAARLMQRFADHPAQTWRQIEGQMAPYRARLRKRDGAYLRHVDQEMDAVCALFKSDDFLRTQKLGPEYLLGYHCQRDALQNRKTVVKIETIETLVKETA